MKRAVLVLALFGVALAQSPRDISNTKGMLRSEQELVFCLDKQNPIWEFEQDMGEAMGKTLGLKVSFHVHREPLKDPTSPVQAIGRTEFLRLFAHYCDVYLGLIGSTTPAFDYPADEQMYATKPYLKISYVLVSKNKNYSNLSKIPKNVVIAMETRSIPYYFMFSTRRGQFESYPTVSSAGTLKAIQNNKAGAGIMFANQVYGRLDPASSGLSVNPIRELPNMDWYVIAGIRRERPALRQQIDNAIYKLLQSGQVAALLKKHKLANAYIQPAALDAQKPESESFDDD